LIQVKDAPARREHRHFEYYGAEIAANFALMLGNLTHIKDF